MSQHRGEWRLRWRPDCWFWVTLAVWLTAGIVIWLWIAGGAR